MRKKLFFDLDGTLLNSRNRLYLLFQNLVPHSSLSFDEYWALKRNGKSHRQILASLFSYSEERILSFEREWLDKIELSQWLELDQPFQGVTEYLEDLRERHSLYVVTARQNERLALQQLDTFRWSGLFDKIFVTSQKKEKYDLIAETVTCSTTDWLIGDTGKDILTGKQLGIQTAAVLSGFLNRETLLKYSPDVIVNCVLDLGFD